MAIDYRLGSGEGILTDGSRHGKDSEDTRAVPVDDPAAGVVDPLQLVRSIRLPYVERKRRLVMRVEFTRRQRGGNREDPCGAGD